MSRKIVVVGLQAYDADKTTLCSAEGVDEIIANVLRLFGAGVKVACEVTCMATDAGLVRANEDVVGIGGTSDGADTAILVKATNTHTFFDIRIREIICKPRM